MLLVAFLDWTDDDTWLVVLFFPSMSCHLCSAVVIIATLTRWFMLATATSHWIFSEDYPNFLVK